MSGDETRSRVYTLKAKEVEKCYLYGFCVGKVGFTMSGIIKMWRSKGFGAATSVALPYKATLVHTTQKCLMIGINLKILMINCQKLK